MGEPDKWSPYLETSLNAYRSGVKSFGREILVLGLFVIVVCTLAMSYLIWTEQKHAKQAEIESVRKELEAAQKAGARLEQIKKNLILEKEIIRGIAKTTSADLINRWQGFLQSIRKDFSIITLRPDLFEEISSYQSKQISGQVSPGIPNQPAKDLDDPRLQIKKSKGNRAGIRRAGTARVPIRVLQHGQLGRHPDKPPGLPLKDYYIDPDHLDPRIIFNKVYGRSNVEIDILLRPNILRENVFRDREAYDIGLKVFVNQIRWGYDKLNQRLYARYLAITVALDKSIQILNKSLVEIHLEPLPTGKELLPEPKKVEPSDLSSYATESEKLVTMIRDTQELTERLDITNTVFDGISANVRQAEKTISKQNRKIKEEIDDLEKKIVQTKEDINKFQEQLKSLSQFTSWMPGGVTVGTKTFIRITPLLLGIILLLMGIRYSRLTEIYRRLSTELHKHHLSGDEILLILTVPDSLLECFGGFQPGHLRSLRAVLLVLPAGMFIGIYFLIRKILQNPQIESGGNELFAAALITAALGALLVYGTVLRSAMKKETS